MTSSPDAPLLPMLPGVADAPFDSPRHLFELKWGGIRTLARVERSRLRLFSQSGRDITAWFPELARMVGQLRVSDALLDGEIVPLGTNGDPDLSLVRERLAGDVDRPDDPLCLYQAYDLLSLKGESLLDWPLVERKAALVEVLKRAGPAVTADGVEGEGIAYFHAVAQRRLPGIVAKDRASPYLPGVRSAFWQEVRVYESGWFVIGGYVLGVGSEGPVGALLVGEPTPGERLRYVGQVSGGLPGEQLEPLLAPLTAASSPFVAPPDIRRLIYWLRPELVCDVKYARREPEGRLRFPVFVTLRPDLSPRDCMPLPPAGASRAPAR